MRWLATPDMRPMVTPTASHRLWSHSSDFLGQALPVELTRFSNIARFQSSPRRRLSIACMVNSNKLPILSSPIQEIGLGPRPHRPHQRQRLVLTDADAQRRLDNPEDFVRREIATALKRNIRVIPALIVPLVSLVFPVWIPPRALNAPPPLQKHKSPSRLTLVVPRGSYLRVRLCLPLCPDCLVMLFPLLLAGLDTILRLLRVAVAQGSTWARPAGYPSRV